MAISAKDVMELRKQTDCGMMECKKALTQADGDFAKAIEILKANGVDAYTMGVIVENEEKVILE